MNSFTQLLESSKANFLKCLKKSFDDGFAKDLEVPDSLEILQYPLVHLAGMFFKYKAIDMLVHLGFERNPRSPRTGELPLHSMLRHGYDAGLKLYKSFALNSYFDKMFPKIFQSFAKESNMIELLLHQDQNGDTPLHVAAKEMIKLPAPSTRSLNVATQVPDSTQECESSTSKRKPSDDTSLVCKKRHPAQHRYRADYYVHCLGHILKKLQEVATKGRKVNINLVKPVLLVKNNDGETFLQIMCKEHHLLNAAISMVLSRFPDAAFYESVRKCVPSSCWPDACLQPFNEESSTENGDNQSETVSSPMELSNPSDTESGKKCNTFLLDFLVSHCIVLLERYN